MNQRLTPRRQGDIGELSAMEWLAGQGAHVYIPLGHSPDVDLVADLDGALLRVEVKTSTRRVRGRWHVLIATRGGNRSWSGVVKHFEPSRCDYLFVAVADGRRWFIPTEQLDCRSGMTLGGPKYAEFEIDPGRPFPGASLESQAARGSAGAGEPGQTVNLVALPEWVRIPPPPSSRRLTPPRENRTRISSKHQITIPVEPFEEAALAVGDRLYARAEGTGRVILERVGGPSDTLAPDHGPDTRKRLT